MATFFISTISFGIGMYMGIAEIYKEPWDFIETYNPTGYASGFIALLTIAILYGSFVVLLERIFSTF